MRFTHSSSQYLQTPEGHISRHAGRMAVDQQRDGNEAKVDQERNDVEHEEPLEEHKVGQDAGAKPASYLLHGTLPKLQSLPG